MTLLAVAPAAGFQRSSSRAVRSPVYSTTSEEVTKTVSPQISVSPVKGSSSAPAPVNRNVPVPVKNVNQKDPFVANGGAEQVQGGSLKTWTFADPRVQRAQVVLETQGRPLNSKIELWQGPDNSPYKLDVYLEDGNLRPLKAMIELPGSSNTIAIRNEGQIEFPLSATVEAGSQDGSTLMEVGKGRVVQGGAVYTTPFDPQVQSVKLVLQTDGRPMNARIELMQGPYNDKQVMEIYTEDGLERPFICVIETPGVGNVVRIVNTATVEFPLKASVDPYEVDTY